MTRCAFRDGFAEMFFLTLSRDPRGVSTTMRRVRRMMRTMLSYANGASTTPLLGETIGQNLRRTAERVAHGDALVVRSQGYRATYRELWDATSRIARALLEELGLTSAAAAKMA